MRTMQKISATVTAAAVAALAAAPVASAATLDGSQTATAVAGSSLSLSVPATVATAGVLTPGQTTTFTPSAIAVVAPLGSWALTVSDASNAGKLKAATGATCTGSDANLTNAIAFTASTTVAGATGSGSVGAAAAPVVSNVGSLADTVNITYSVDVPAEQQLKAGCVYSTNLAYTLTG